jgi:next to BRCA1 gene 1 protein
MRDGLGVSTRHYAKCDGCKKDIYGIRYKCMHPDCPDFDLCAMCEAHPIPTHPSKHPMLKMKTADTAIPTVYRVGQTTLINDRGSVEDNAVRDEEKALPTPPMSTNADNENPAAEALSRGHTVNTGSSSASSTAGFTLPPLALDPRNDLFREFWPKITEELKQTQGSQTTSHILDNQQLIPIEPIASVPAPTNVEAISDPFCDPKPNANFIPSPDLSTQALLTRPMSVPTMPEMAQQTMIPVTTHSRSLAALLNGYRSPSPNFTTSLATSMSSLDGISQNETTPAIPASPAQEVVVPLMASFVSDMTGHDGQIFPPGAEFVKCWRMVNNGSRDWPETTELHYSAGETFSLEHSGSQKVKVGKVAAGLQADVWSGELKVPPLFASLIRWVAHVALDPQAPEAPGKYRGYWRLSDGEGTYFGHSLWVECVVLLTCTSTIF